MQNQPMAQPKRVVVVGGGVAGLSAAHELALHGFIVDVYERKDIFGGKARSLDFHPTSDVVLPAEHGFRFFPGFYRHVTNTMEKIPSGNSNVAAHLVQLSELRAVGDPATNPVLGVLPLRPAWRPSGFVKWVEFLPSLVAVSPGPDGKRMNGSDLAFFARKIWQFLTASPERRERDFESVPWSQFIGGAERSDAYMKYLGVGLTRNLVACKAEQASTLTVGTIGFQLIWDALRGLFVSSGLDRVLDGPTNKVWIDPWVDHLRALGVSFHPNRELKSIALDERGGPGNNGRRPRISGLRFRGTESDRAQAEHDRHTNRVYHLTQELATQPPEVANERLAAETNGAALPPCTADYYVFAVPVEQMSTYVTSTLRTAIPEWEGLTELAKSVEWMNGVLFYMTEKSPFPTGHTDFIDSDWALTSIFQDDSLWPAWSTQRGTDSDIAQILSIDVSNWTARRTNGPQAGRSASELRRQEVIEEVWAQVQQAVTDRTGYALDRRNRRYAYIDDDIQDRLNVRKALTFHRHRAARGGRASDPLLTNAEPLLVNQIGTRRLRPFAAGSLENGFLASDYVRTTTDLATMEGANEAARRAVNGILRAEGRDDTCELFPLKEPLAFLRNWDRRRFERGRPPSPVVQACGVALGFGVRGVLLASQILAACIRITRRIGGFPPRLGEVVRGKRQATETRAAPISPQQGEGDPARASVDGA